MRWNLQVRASGAAAPPSATGPAPSQAWAAAGRAPRAGSELGLRPVAPAAPHAAPATSFAGPCGRWWPGPPGGRPGSAASRRRRKMAAGWRNQMAPGPLGVGPSRGGRRRAPAGVCVRGGGASSLTLLGPRSGRPPGRPGRGWGWQWGRGSPEPTRVHGARLARVALASCRARL